MDVPTIDGGRIRLEPLSRSHARGMFALWSEPLVCAHAGPAEDATGREIALPADSLSDSDRLLEFWLDRSRAGTGFRWAVIDTEAEGFLGAVGFNALGECAEYAYHFHPRCWGEGLATEASRLAVEWAFSEGSEAIEVFIEPANTRSIRLAERLGFERAGESTGAPERYVLHRPASGA